MPNLHIILALSYRTLTGVHIPPLPSPPASAIVCAVTATFAAPGGGTETDAAAPLSVPYAAATVIEGRPVSPGVPGH